MDTASFDSELSLFKYDDLDPVPEAYRDLDPARRQERIAAVRAELGDDVLVLGHNYQREEIVELADFVGDSYALSTRAAEADAETVVFAGVTFMAESADIITDADQSVVLPSVEASCPMAGMAEALQVDAAWADLTEVASADSIVPICYMNSYADLKAFCGEHGGLVCTSSNAARAFEWALDRGETVLFLPDKHLGVNTARDLGIDDATVIYDPWDPDGLDPATALDNDLVVWDGYCQVHDRFTTDHVEAVRAEDPEVSVVVHPECRPSVVESADAVGSTAQIRTLIEDADPGETWAVGTEIHMVNHLDRWADADVRALCGDACSDCNAMRQIDPAAVLWVLESIADGSTPNVVSVDPETAEYARTALDRMLDL
ncbi:quinolinate synthase NadA [Halococcoides cellulosivorans]|nr:quinolinate synthase NadA [Halococcoides cellulosivorans]